MDSLLNCCFQCFGSGFGLDLDSFGSVDPDPDWESTKANKTTKKKKVNKFHVLKCRIPGTAFLNSKNLIFFSNV